MRRAAARLGPVLLEVRRSRACAPCNRIFNPAFKKRSTCSANDPGIAIEARPQKVRKLQRAPGKLDAASDIEGHGYHSEREQQNGLYR